MISLTRGSESIFVNNFGDKRRIFIKINVQLTWDVGCLFSLVSDPWKKSCAALNAMVIEQKITKILPIIF
jgi:hypothetical protein